MKLYAAADIDYDLLVDHKPVLTAAEKAKTTLQPPKDLENATVTIIVVSN